MTKNKQSDEIEKLLDRILTKALYDITCRFDGIKANISICTIISDEKSKKLNIAIQSIASVDDDSDVKINKQIIDVMKQGHN